MVDCRQASEYEETHRAGSDGEPDESPRIREDQREFEEPHRESSGGEQDEPEQIEEDQRGYEETTPMPDQQGHQQFGQQYREVSPEPVEATAASLSPSRQRAEDVSRTMEEARQLMRRIRKTTVNSTAVLRRATGATQRVFEQLQMVFEWMTDWAADVSGRDRTLTEMHDDFADEMVNVKRKSERLQETIASVSESADFRAELRNAFRRAKSEPNGHELQDGLNRLEQKFKDVVGASQQAGVIAQLKDDLAARDKTLQRQLQTIADRDHKIQQLEQELSAMRDSAPLGGYEDQVDVEEGVAIERDVFRRRPSQPSPTRQSVPRGMFTPADSSSFELTRKRVPPSPLASTPKRTSVLRTRGHSRSPPSMIPVARPKVLPVLLSQAMPHSQGDEASPQHDRRSSRQASAAPSTAGAATISSAAKSSMPSKMVTAALRTPSNSGKLASSSKKAPLSKRRTKAAGETEADATPASLDQVLAEMHLYHPTVPGNRVEAADMSPELMAILAPSLEIFQDPDHFKSLQTGSRKVTCARERAVAAAKAARCPVLADHSLSLARVAQR
ncbi:hypothetical protein B0A55_04147 [Friedmanniomyces simplex]|uniref:Uncharacterized protein n=1 Tax=Friedmanniomyces simplex TaxID=329884 RepID=A0A4U0XRL9_9PEZI|nr:hypothetical protein B0A55_04147 [Friedmanniomyces simplex]